MAYNEIFICPSCKANNHEGHKIEWWDTSSTGAVRKCKCPYCRFPGKTPKKWSGSAPNFCNYCDKRIYEAFVDGRTVHGSWGIFCLTCFSILGEGLGTGRGQLYGRIQEDWIMIEG